MIDSNVLSIWQRPMYLPYVQPVLTDEIVRDAEKKIGYRLPGKYIDLLKIQNGGYIRYTLHETVHDQIYGIGPYYPSVTDVDWEEYSEYVSFELNGLVPFDGDGHWYICFDYRKNPDEPQITWIDTETDSEEIIAEHFSAYLSLLHLKIDGELVIQTNESIEEVTKKIAEVLQVTFEEPDYWAHGYAQYRSSYKDGWIWVEPNSVPRGFIREGEERYDELKELMKGQVPRFPEIADSSIFISFSSDDIQKELLKKLIQHSFSIKPLKELLY